MKKMNKKGFTIVELVIVIAVIAILAAVLIPTFSGVVDKANASSAQQTAKSTLTNALSMSSNAQLKKDTKIVIDGYAFNYTGNQLESCDYPSTTKNNQWVLGTGYNAIIISADSLEDKTAAKAVSNKEFTAVNNNEMVLKNDAAKIVAKLTTDNALGCLAADINAITCVIDGKDVHYYVNYADKYEITTDTKVDTQVSYFTFADNKYTKVTTPAEASLSTYYVITGKTYDAEIFVNSDFDKDVVVFTNFDK